VSASHASERTDLVSKLLRGLVAGWGAKKMGCGCFGTIIAFLILWWLLGNFEIFQ
jgi:hypothetical protein